MDLPGRKERKAAVESKLFVFFFGIGLRMARECHPAAQDQPAEEPAHPAVSLRFVERRTHVARASAKAERHALVVGRGHVQRPSRQQGKAKSRCVEYLNKVRASIGSLAQFAVSGMGYLTHVAHEIEQFSAGKLFTK